MVTALQFLTRLPLPALPGFEPPWLAQAVRYFPLVGVLVGVGNVAVWWLAGRLFPPGVSIGLTLAASMLFTGAFHEDGFADFCDGFGGGTTRARVFEIMKDSRLGTYGAVGIFMMLALKWSTLAALPDRFLPLALVSAHMVSRWCAIGLIWRLPYVSPEAHARAAAVAGSMDSGRWLAAGLIGMLGLIAVLVPAGLPASDRAAAVALTGLLSGALAAGLAAVVMAVYCRRRIGGYTGDCLGAVQQVTELSFLLAGLAVTA